TAHYPQRKILRAAARNNTFASMFGQIIEPQIKVASRFNGDRAMCPTRRETLAPRIGQTVSGEKKTIVNVEGYTQTVTVERCDANAECFKGGTFSGQDNFECRTHYVNIGMVVYNKDGSIGIEHFPVAAGCYCS
ncbi:hypothetical protein AMK59_5785, partial [Oryctes borbonicus]